MNDHYKYAGKTLTPGIAVELIQELFAGQAVQKQEMISNVDEVHLERGGLPSRAQFQHPVTLALSKMKQAGLVENLRRGTWFILPVELSLSEEPISTLGGFTEWTKKFAPGDYVFRGVPNHEYGIEASAYRRPAEEDRSFQKFLQINRDLIEEAKLRGYDEKNGRTLNDLEILAELQHFGAATCLIDFTYNALVALWFACQVDSKGPKDSDGKVSTVYNQSSEFKEIKSDLLTRKINEFLQDNDEPQLYHWKPRQQNNRIIAQQSIFLFGHYKFDAYAECIILQNSKESILTELEQVAGITEMMLFPDFDGFARLRGEGKKYMQLGASEYLELAEKQGKNHEYEKVIDSCNRALDQDQDQDLDYAKVYYIRGLAQHHLEQYQLAIIDFEQSIEKNEDYYEVYYYRAEAYYQDDRFSEAREDLQKALLLAREVDDEEFADRIEKLLDEINSRTAGGSKDE